ncbi:hypothetical protein ERJ75_001042000 [Trypanosoma vivax]|uniref:Uncharacterized protein n=1 Tax=Trypanosoma vivax (strain Y486) TaxID=1055687 RepID=G0TUW2_TRYVY|nr:hypothetical protein TRVL_09775 [Trypanosoma vivax]KAH8610837.1 hypothetical protein ERJ75_001042000 [Trypanosoma vivax]CCC47749.1 conserved hypothetical protein [Trypanosoma vivax Y486]
MELFSKHKKAGVSEVGASKRERNVRATEYHTCKCYGHTSELPDYKQLSIPRTLQGFYAKQNHLCPCIPTLKNKNLSKLYCCHKPSKSDKSPPAEDYREHEPGKHQVLVAGKVPADGTGLRDPVTAKRLLFPNACNYGGTAAQHKFPRIGEPRRKTYRERMEERMFDRKEFLKALLREEIQCRLDAEQQLEEIENETGLRGSRHLQALAEMAEIENQQGVRDTKKEPMDVGQRYNAMMEELQHVVRQPVGSKHNIIRMHYALEEDERQELCMKKGRRQARAP